MIFEKVLKNIDEGIAGLNVGLPFKVSKLHDCIPSISKGQCWLIGAETGCLGIHTKIIMYDGSLKNVEDIVIGDQLMGIDSTPRNVLSLHRGIEMMYDVIQNKGITYKVNQSHILSLKPSGEKSNKKFNSTTNIKISDFVNLNITDKKNLKGYKANSIQHSFKPILIDPYLLGLWLGDGSSTKPQFTNIDNEIIEYIYQYANNTKQTITVSSNISYSIVRPNKKIIQLDNNKCEIKTWDSLTEACTHLNMLVTNLSQAAKTNIKCGGFYWKYYNEGTKCLMTLLSNYNLINNKHIPDNYLYNTIECRLQLLAGLIDSDGSYTLKRNSFEITQKRKILSEQIVYLARSLGFYTSIVEKIATMKRKNNTIYECLVYRISIHGYLDVVPTKVKRKKAKISTRITNPLVTGIQIVKDKIDNYYGFNLDGDNLFLLEDFTVTHNCGKTSFVDDVFLYTPFEYIMSSSNINKYTFNVLYFSYEITSINKIAKAICRNLFLKHNKEIDTKILLSKGKYRLDSEIRKLVDFEKEYFEKLEKCINIYDIAENPTGIYKIVNRYAEQHFDKIEHNEFNIEYVEKNPNHYTIVIIDHAALVRKERGYDTKQTIDKLSEYLVGFRNKYNFITVLIQQLNRGLESTERKKAEMLYPQLSDFKDSANTQADSNIVLALFNPHKYNMTSLGNIVIDGTKKLRGCFVLKNRDGESDKNTVLEFVGSCGIFKTIN